MLNEYYDFPIILDTDLCQKYGVKIIDPLNFVEMTLTLT
jgi:hypothetical protein